jgi:predicted nuclease of predicted toxin-antitoxin system
MKFIVDAQLPWKLARYLRDAGYDTIHTLDLPAKNQTPDEIVRTIAAAEHRIVISKDNDFRDSFHLRHNPKRLLHCTFGNVVTKDVLSIFALNFENIIAALQQSDLVELAADRIILWPTPDDRDSRDA